MCSLGQNSKSRTFDYKLTMSHVKSFMSLVTLISIPFILGLNCVYTMTAPKQIRAYHTRVYFLFSCFCLYKAMIKQYRQGMNFVYGNG